MNYLILLLTAKFSKQKHQTPHAAGCCYWRIYAVFVLLPEM
jgi:hypothetical protein